MERFEYFRSQIVSGNTGTIVYWADRWDGESFDIHPDDIPVGEIVKDVTHINSEDPKEYVMTSNGLIEK